MEKFFVCQGTRRTFLPIFPIICKYPWENFPPGVLGAGGESEEWRMEMIFMWKLLWHQLAAAVYWLNEFNLLHNFPFFPLASHNLREIFLLRSAVAIHSRAINTFFSVPHTWCELDFTFNSLSTVGIHIYCRFWIANENVSWSLWQRFTSNSNWRISLSGRFNCALILAEGWEDRKLIRFNCFRVSFCFSHCTVKRLVTIGS